MKGYGTIMASGTKARPVPFEEIERAIIAEYESEGTNPRVIYRVRSTLGLMIDGAGVFTSGDLGQPTIDWFRAHHPHKLQTLQSIWNRAARAGLVEAPAAPFAEAHAPRSSAARTTPPTPEEVSRFARHAAGLIGDWIHHRDFALAALIRFTGMIVQDAIRLSVADIDLAGGVILSRRHEHARFTRTPPRINIVPELAEILAAWAPRTDCEWAFPGITRQGPWAASGHKTPQARMAMLSRGAGLEEGRGITHERLRRYHKERLGFPTEPGWLKPATPADSPNHTIRIGDSSSPILIDGRPVRQLTKAQRAIVLALLDAGAEGLSGEEIKDKTSLGGWRPTLRALRESDPLWGCLIVFPGFPHGRYRIAAVRLSG